MGWKQKKGYNKSSTQIAPMGGKPPHGEATFVPEGVTAHAKKKHKEYAKMQKQAWGGTRKPLIGE